MASFFGDPADGTDGKGLGGLNVSSTAEFIWQVMFVTSGFMVLSKAECESVLAPPNESDML